MSGLVFSEAREADAWFELQHVDTQNLLLARSLCRFLSDYRYSTEASDEKILEALKGILSLSTKTMFTDLTIVATTPTYASFSNIAISQKFVRNLDDYYDRQREALAAATDDAIHISSDLRTPVWGSREPTPATEKSHRRLLEEWDERAEWKFWHRFYDGMWNGTFGEWDLALEVIQIDKEIWEEGVEEIAAEIEQLARDLAKRSLDALQLPLQNRHGIGGNNPPPDQVLETATAQIVEGATLIRAQSDASNPDKTLIERGLSLMGKGLLEITKWIGRKVDLTVDQLIKWGVPAGCAYLVTNPAKVQAAINAAKTWLALL